MGKKSQQQTQYSEVLSTLNELLTDAKSYRNKWEIKSYVNESFYEWNHSLVFNKNTGNFEALQTSGSQYAIGKTRKIVRWLRNSILKNDPRWHASKGGEVAATDDEIDAAYALLKSVWKRCHLKDKLKDAVTHSVLKTTSWVYVWFDRDNDDFDVFVEDPFNIYTSPDGRMEWPVFVGSYMIRTIARSLNEIKSNPLYKNWPAKDDLDCLETTDQMAESEMKAKLLSDEHVIPRWKNGMCLIHEFYTMERVKKELSKEDKKEGETISEEKKEIEDLYVPQEDQLFEKDEYRVRIITKVWNVIIRDEMTDYKTFPFIGYQAERNTGKIYHPAWIEPVISLNKALDDAYSNRAEWLEQFAKWRYLKKKDVKMSIIRSKNGQIVEYEGWTAPTLMDRWNLPQEVNIHMSDTERYMEDIGWQHSDSMWRASGDKSGIAIAQLQAADMNNVSEPVDNMRTFLEELSYRILDMADSHMKLRVVTNDEGKDIPIAGNSFIKWEEQKTAKKSGKEIVRIKPLRNIDVEIIPGSAFSDMQMRQDLVELRKLEIPIPDEMILDAYKLGNTQSLIKKWKDEQEEKMENQDWVDGLEAKQAELETQKLLNGVPISPQEWENHQVHLAIHTAALQNFKQWDPRAELLMNHCMETEALLNWPQPQEPWQPNQQ